MAELLRTSPAKTLDALRTIVIEGNVREGVPSDNVCGVMPELHIEPANETELSRVLQYANQNGLQVSPRGGGTKADWGLNPQSIELMVSTARFSRILEHAPGDMTVTVESGVTISQLQNALLQHRQRLALDPLWPDRATVAGVIATNDTGALRIRYGGVRDLIIGLTVVLPDGVTAMSGGKVVKNVAGYDLPKLMTGAFGTLGFITKAVFRLHPMSESTQTLTFSFIDRERANKFMLAITDSVVVPTGLQLRTSSTGETFVDIRIDGIAAGIEAQTNAVLKLATAAKPSQPTNAPWLAREQLWHNSDSAVICKLSMLPTQLSATAEFAREALSDNADWSLLMHSTGLAYLRVDAADCTQLADCISSIRAFLAPTGGTAVVLKAPVALRQQVDVWGDPGTALPLMKRIKHQFDPRGVLNRGRFVGGI
jgi:glycolate oxidase FAD binding subunit